jgi:hypothetical protein
MLRGRRLFLARHPEFAKLWAGYAISSSGSAVTALAMPLTAVLLLHASPVQMGVLSALTMLPHLLFGLPAGVWVDRLPRRSILVTADVGRALLLGSVPVLGALGVLRIEHLYAVAFLAGVMTLLFDAASATLVPALVGREDLVQANSAWVLNVAVAGTVGPSVAGGLVELLTAPATIALDAASFLVSAGCSLLVRVPPGEGVARGRGPVRLRSEIGEGLRTLFGSPVLSAVAVSATAGALAGAMQGPLVVLYLVRDLSLSPAVVGLAVTVAGVGAVAGALLAPAYSRWVGLGRAYVSGQLVASWQGSHWPRQAARRWRSRSSSSWARCCAAWGRRCTASPRRRSARPWCRVTCWGGRTPPGASWCSARSRSARCWAESWARGSACGLR